MERDEEKYGKLPYRAIITLEVDVWAGIPGRNDAEIVQFIMDRLCPPFFVQAKSVKVGAKFYIPSPVEGTKS